MKHCMHSDPADAGIAGCCVRRANLIQTTSPSCQPDIADVLFVTRYRWLRKRTFCRLNGIRVIIQCPRQSPSERKRQQCRLRSLPCVNGPEGHTKASTPPTPFVLRLPTLGPKLKRQREQGTLMMTTTTSPRRMKQSLAIPTPPRHLQVSTNTQIRLFQLHKKPKVIPIPFKLHPNR